MKILIILIIILILYLIKKSYSNKKEGIKSIHISSNFKVITEKNVTNLLKRALSMQITKNYHGAIAIADKILILSPNNYKALIIRADCLSALKYNLDAIDDYEKVISIDDSDPNLIGLLGMSYHAVGEFEKGQEKLLKSIQMGYNLFKASYNINCIVGDYVRNRMINDAKRPENLLRRNTADFIDDESEIENIKIIKALKVQIKDLRYAFDQNPNNIEIKELYEYYSMILGNYPDI